MIGTARVRGCSHFAVGITSIMAVLSLVVDVAVAMLLRDRLHRVIQLVHGPFLGLVNLAGLVHRLHIVEIVVVVEGAGLQVILEEGRWVVWNCGPTGERAVGGVTLSVLMVGELVSDAAVGLGWREPADWQA